MPWFWARTAIGIVLRPSRLWSVLRRWSILSRQAWRRQRWGGLWPDNAPLQRWSGLWPENPRRRRWRLPRFQDIALGTNVADENVQCIFNASQSFLQGSMSFGTRHLR